MFTIAFITNFINMSVRFENQESLEREHKAVLLFCCIYDYTYEKLGDHDIDFKIYKDGKLVCYLEVKGRNKTIAEAYPLPIAIRKLHNLADKRTKGVILWDCLDGLIYADYTKLEGTIKVGGRRIPRKGAANDIELMAYYQKSEHLHEYKFK